MTQRQTLWPWILGIVLVAGLGWWLFWPRQQAGQGADEAPVTGAATAPAASAPADPAAATPEPAIQHPIASDDAAAPALPALADSDATAWEALSGLVGGNDALALLIRDHLIQRLVVMVDNLTQPRIATRALAVTPVPGTLGVDASEAGTTLAAANAQRYAPYVQAFTRIDAGRAAATYAHFYPLFQQAYAELGTQGYFNDRLVAVIDHLLQAPEPAQPPALQLNDSGKYRFVDPALESLSVGQKALVRLGPEQEAAVKAQLRRLRAALART